MKVLCLNGEYNIKNLSSLFDSIKIGNYDSVDYSHAILDEYSKIFLDSYNEQIKIPGIAQSYSSEFLFKELKYLGGCMDFGKLIFKKCNLDFQNKYFYSNVIFDLYAMGTETFGVIAFLSFFLGVNFGYQSYIQLNELGLSDNGMTIIILSAFKQSGVLVSFVVLLTKYSSAIIAKVGFMRISEEWTALKLMKIDPEIFLLRTKMYSLIILLPFFAYVSIFFSCFSAFLVFKFYSGTTLQFIFSTSMIKEVKAFFTPLIKGVFIGAALGIISSYEASLVEKSSDNILYALNHGIIMSLVVGFLISVFLDLLFGL